MTKQELIFSGVGASPGIAVGPAFVIDRPTIRAEHPRPVTRQQVASEKERLLEAVESSKQELLETQRHARAYISEPDIGVLDAYVRMTDDRTFISEALQNIEQEQVSAESGLQRAVGAVRRALAGSDDPYLSARADDLEFVELQILQHLQGWRATSLDEIPAGAVVVARHLSPAEAVQLRRGAAVALATDLGGSTSHTAVVARSLGLPAVVGLRRLSGAVRAGDLVAVDGSEGVVVLEPSEESAARYQGRREAFLHHEAELLPEAQRSAVTRDGVGVTVRANVEMLEDLAVARERGGEGVGLYRTEFVYLGRGALPTEEEHYEVYREAVEQASPHPVTIRTLDLGGDKLPVPFHRSPVAFRASSLRGVRLSLAQPQIFGQQLRGVLRAAAHGPIRLLLPVVSSVDEVVRAKALVEEARLALARRGERCAAHVPLGVMIEVPAAAAIADLLAQEVDFLSIGSNDLIHFLLAIDRGDEHASHLYEPFHPAVVRTLQQVIEEGQRAGVSVSLCGEMARSPAHLFLLLGLGLREISVSCGAIPEVKNFIRSFSCEEASEMVQHLSSMRSAAEIRAAVLQAAVGRL